MWAWAYMVNPSLMKKSPHVPFVTRFPVQLCAAPHHTQEGTINVNDICDDGVPFKKEMLTDLVRDGVCEALVSDHQGWRHKR